MSVRPGGGYFTFDPFHLRRGHGAFSNLPAFEETAGSGHSGWVEDVPVSFTQPSSV